MTPHRSIRERASRPAAVAAAALASALVSALVGACAGSPGIDASQRPAEPRWGDGADLAPPAVLPQRGPAAPPLLPAPAPAISGAPAASASGELARVGSRSIRLADLGDFVTRWNPEVAAAALDRLVRTALVEDEAAREGADAPAALVAAAADRALEARLRRIRLEGGAGTDAEAVLRRTTGRTPDALRRDLAAAVRIDLLRERLARLEALRRDGVEVRVAVVPDERDAATFAARWREGADAALLARKLSLRDPESPPPVALDDVPDPALRARLAAAAEGDVLDPVAFEAEDPREPGSVRSAWQVFRVVRSWKGTGAAWADVAARVEDWLRTTPPDERELAAWEARAARRAGLTLAGVSGAASPPSGTIPPR